jgi:hypothetical protein
MEALFVQKRIVFFVLGFKTRFFELTRIDVTIKFFRVKYSILCKKL